MSRLDDLIAFYQALARLEARCGGKRLLRDSHGRTGWPRRGVYFFFEEGEPRQSTGVGPRVVRVGTHALAARSSTTLWNRLAQHRGNADGKGGNHRGSIFRLLVGNALRQRDSLHGMESWGVGSDPGKAAARMGQNRVDVLERESKLEHAVSGIIGAMPVLWLEVDDPTGPGSLRGYIERNAIALLSNYGRNPLDTPSARWLGLFCDRERVRQSGLWNNNHVDETYDPNFVARLEELIRDPQ